MKIFAMSDIHGHSWEFEEALKKVDLSKDNKLILLGDYVHGPDDGGVLDKIMQLQEQYGTEKVIALKGNHEEMVLTGDWTLAKRYSVEQKSVYYQWMKNLPLYHVEGKTIFVHAGIDEEADELWETGTFEDVYIWKYPAQTGRFYGNMKIVAGHVATHVISRNKSFHDIYYDGESHYYIDGAVRKSKKIPVLMVDTERETYYQVTETGPWLLLPYDEEWGMEL